MFVLLGDTDDQAAKEATAVLTIETALAQGSMSRLEMRDPDKRYHIMTVAETQALSPDFDWAQFLKGNGMGSVRTLNVSSPGFVKTVNETVEGQDLAALKSYMRWHALHRAAPGPLEGIYGREF